MREIKFRAWASAIKQMVYMGGPKCVLYGYDEGEEWGMFFPFKSKQACLAGYDAVMQFTGLKDKNLNDIYEGDIVKNHYLGCGTVGEVKFVNGSFRLGENNNLHEWATQEPNLVDIEVIGNIYENPDLLAQREKEK